VRADTQAPPAAASQAAVRLPVPAWVLLGAAMAVAAAFLLWNSRGVSFYFDDWILYSFGVRDGLDAVLEPRNGHLMLTTVLAYGALLEPFGADSLIHLRILTVALQLTAAGLFFVFARRRVGDAVALALAVLLLFLGAGWETRSAPYGLNVWTAICPGIGALVALDRGTRRGDIACCVLLVLAAIGHSAGLPFLVAVAVAIVLRDRRDWLRRSWVFAIPAALYALWLLAFRLGEESYVTADNVTGLVTFVPESLAAVLAALSGLFDLEVARGAQITTGYGRPLAVIALVAVAALMVLRPRTIRPLGWGLAAAALTYFVLLGLNTGPARPHNASRYMIPGGFYVLLLAVELAAGYRISRRLTAVICALVAIALVGNVRALGDGGETFRDDGAANRATLAALELTRGTVPPDLRAEPLEAETSFGHDLQLTAAEYFEAESRYGSPAYSPEDLSSAPPAAREAADLAFVRALGIAPVAAPAAQGGQPRCEPREAGTAELPVPAGGLTLRVEDSGETEIALRRYGDAYTPLVPVEPAVAGPALVEVAIPADRSRVPWVAKVVTPAPFALCGPLR
jgi:hypothetical protein